MKKLHLTALIAIALGALILFAVAVFFNFYTYNEDNSIRGDWRTNESMMYLGTAKIITLIITAVITLGIILFIIQNKSIIKQNIMGILFIALSAIIIAGSLNLFFPCTEMVRMNDRPMRCYWTMKSLFGLTGAIGISGVLMLLFHKSKEIIKGLNCAVVMLSCLYILTPLKMTEGFCSAMTGSHPCLEKFRPFTLMLGCLILALSLINIFLLFRKTKQSN